MMCSRIYTIEGGWYDGVSYECFLYDPETKQSRMVYGGPGTRKKDIVKWLKRKHSTFNWKLKTSYTGSQWIYTFSKK